MDPLIAVIAIFFVVVPVGLLFWIWHLRQTSRVIWASSAAAAGLYLLALHMTAGWQILSIYWQYVLIIACAGLVLATIWRVRREPWWTNTRGEWISVGIHVLVVGISVFQIVNILGSWEPPAGADPVDVAFPMRGGQIYVVAAGGTPAGNPHMMVLDDNPRFEPWKGQAYALDAVALNARGRRSTGLYPSDPAAYAVFGMPLFSPCSGEVVRVQTGFPDLAPPEQDLENKGGNYVVIRCAPEETGREDVRAVIAHIKQGSMQVEEGQSVTRETRVGAVGNSGKTSEPHLHFHLQVGGRDDAPMSGTPVPASFEGVYPVQSDTLCARNDGSVQRFPCETR